MIAPATIDMVSDANTLSEGARRRLGEYLNAFLAPVFDDEKTHVKCPCCGSRVYGGGILDALLGTFEWGIVHGDGFCSRCKWPIRMYHFVDLDNGEQRIVFPLAYRIYEDEERAREIDPANRKHESED
jgi:hypothetical protein